MRDLMGLIAGERRTYDGLSEYQDFHVRIFSKNLTAMLAFPTPQDIEKNGEDKLYSIQPKK